MSTLTSKELTALEETLGSEQMYVKKFQTAASMCNDPALRNRLEQIASKHQTHYNTLLSYLK